MLNLSKKFGFDARRQQARLAMLGLTGDHKAQCYRLQREIIRPHKDEIARTFMQWLRGQDDLLKFLANVQHDVLFQGLTSYLETFGIINMETYFELRLRVGLTHWMLDVPVSLFTCGHRMLQQLIVDLISNVCAPDEARQLTELTLKITALDLTLVTDTYRLAQVHHLVRELKNQMDETHKYKTKANKDSLTGLPNRERVMALADEALRSSREVNLSLCLVMLDIDHFKQVNDTYGHPTGDGVLVSVAQTMRNALRNDDIIGRYGGEEFMIVLRAPRPDEFWSVAERLRLLVAAKPIGAQGNVVPVTVSQGLALATPQDTLGSLIKRADAALYDAKHQGRNRVLIAPETPPASTG